MFALKLFLYQFLSKIVVVLVITMFERTKMKVMRESYVNFNDLNVIFWKYKAAEGIAKKIGGTKYDN